MRDLFKDLIDNDTLIILGLLIIIGWMTANIQALIVGGLLASLKTSKGGK